MGPRAQTITSAWQQPSVQGCIWHPKKTRSVCTSSLRKQELGEKCGEYGGCRWNEHFENADAVLEGRSSLAVVTAVHPSDAFIVQSTNWRHPRKFFTQARSGDKGAHSRLGKAKITHDESWVTGSVDLVLFDARCGTFTGPIIERVPLFLVNGAGRMPHSLSHRLSSSDSSNTT